MKKKGIFACFELNYQNSDFKMRNLCVTLNQGIRHFSCCTQLQQPAKWLGGKQHAVKWLGGKVSTICYLRFYENIIHTLITRSCTLTPNLYPSYKEKSIECFDSLPSKKEVYELTMVDVKPECWKQYITHKGNIYSFCNQNWSLIYLMWLLIFYFNSFKLLWV